MAREKYVRFTLISVACLLFLLACGQGGDESGWPTDLPINPEDGNHFDSMADPFFEGWYHKVDIPERNESFFFVYGIINPKPGTSYPSEAFLYCGRSKTGNTVYESFPVDAYRAAGQLRDVVIGSDARTTALRMAGQAADDLHSCSWDIWFDGSIPWLKTMGWLTDIAQFQIHWTVGAIKAKARGWVRFDNEKITFDNGYGYSDHNWGSTFPSRWIWVQANGFPGQDAALAAAGGIVPFGNSELEAFMIGLFLDGELVTFRSQDVAAIDAEAEPGHWLINGTQGLKRITIDARCDPSTLFHLKVPTDEGMQPRAWESLSGTVEVVLEERMAPPDPWTTTFTGVSEFGGVELGE